MNTFRSVLTGIGALVAASSPALAASPSACLQPAERAAIETRALQSRLMVAAISCRQEDAYNAFVRKFQPDLGGAYNRAEGHFRRLHGGQGRTRFNQFDTVLANAQSEEGIRAGGALFCRDTQIFFQEAMALPSGDQLARYGAERNILQPYESPNCAAAETQSTPSRSRQRQATRNTSAASARR